MGAALLLAPRRPRAGGRAPARRLQRRPGHRRGGRSGARRRRPPAPRELHGLLGYGPARGDLGGEELVPFTAELGGKGPLLVFADADLDAAAQKAALQYDDSGQNCMAGTRLLVEESVAGEFLERFHAAVDAHVLGDPREESTTISPLIHRHHLARVEGFVERARRTATASCGGRRGRDRGALVRADARRAALERLRDRPARGVRAGAHLPDVPNEDEGVALANSTEYGLAATLYTSSAERADRVGELFAPAPCG